MPKYLIEIRYNAEGARGVKREGGTSRRDTAAKLAEALGGKLEAFYFAFGEVDVYAIVEVPDEKAALAASIAANQTGVSSARFIPLISPETVDAAAKIAPVFRGAGQ
jgi:uncharacterized protein with GYD domain